MTPPLHGIRILDFSQLIAGPSATSMLAELGADVIKVEPPGGDPSRRMGQARMHGVSATFAAYNKGKRSICLDLQKPEGLHIARSLAASADVLIEAFRPRVLERLGLGYETATKLRSDMIYVSFAGFGFDGPMAERPGVDLIIQGESGIMSITGEENGPATKIGFTAVDAAAGFALSQAILAGLVRRLRTGQGSRLQMSLMDVALYMQAGPLTDYMMSGIEPRRSGNMAPLGSPAEVFDTADGQLIVSSYFPNQWPDLCRILDLAHLECDARFADNARRINNRNALHPLLQEQFSQRSSAEWKSLLAPTRIIFGDVLSYDEVIRHPQVLQGDALVPVSVQGGCLKSIGTPLRWADTPDRLDLHAPRLGQHGPEILQELGFEPDWVAAATAAGALI